MASQQPQTESLNDNLNLKNSDTNQSQENATNATKLQNGQTNPAQGGAPPSNVPPASASNSPINDQKNIKSPPSNSNGADNSNLNSSNNSGPPNSYEQHSQGMPPQQPGPQIPHNPMEQKDDNMMGQQSQHPGAMPPQMHQNLPTHQQGGVPPQQNMYGHPQMNMPPHHPMHPSQQHMPPHHLPPHHHQQYPPQQRYHPHQQQHYPMHSQHPQHDPNQQPQMPPNVSGSMGNDPYSHHYRGMIGGKPGMMPVRPPQRYMPPQGQQQGPPNNPAGSPTGQPAPSAPQQGPTPTLNSLLQSQPPNQGGQQGPGPGQPPNQQGLPLPPGQQPPGPGQQPQGPPPQHRGYPNAYDQSPYSPNAGPPMPPQQQSWVPPRPYSPQQGYRGAPPANSSRGQSPYPPQPAQNPGAYPLPPGQQPGPGQQPPGPPGSNPQQQTGAQPPQQQQQQPPSHQPPQQYYPQRYPTPPSNAGQPIGPPSHRSSYPPHQWPSPAASPGPIAGQHSHGPPQSQSPHPHGPPQSPSQHSAPSPSPQPPHPQPAQSPHQYPNRPSQPTTPNTNDTEMGVNQKRNNKNKVKKTKKQQRQEAQGQMNNESNLNAKTGQMSGSNQQQPPPPQQVQQQQPPQQQHPPPPQQSMRPIGSPNSSSSGSRSMSPSVGGQQNLQMPPRPSSNHSQMHPNQPPNSQQQPGVPPQNQLGNTNQPPGQQQPPMEGSASGMTSPGRPPSSGPPQQIPQNYQGPPMQGQQPPHMMGNYKMGGPGPQGGPMAGPYPPPQSQYSQQGNYSPRAQYPNYGPPPTNSMSPNHQYGGRSMPNHVGPPGGHPGQYPYQNWPPGPPPTGSPGLMPNHIQGKNIGPPQSQSPQAQQPPQTQQGPQQQQQGSPAQSPQHQGAPQQIGTGGPQRQLGYLKQHLQHKGGYAGSQSPTPPGPHSQMQGYGNGPGPGMHPPTSMGPPHHMGPPMGPVSTMPPVSTPSSIGGPNHMEGPQMGPQHGMPPHHTSEHSQDNGPGSVTSIITTGPDGAPLDEGSQQSTLSNTSIASGDDQGPKSRKTDFYGPPHMSTPNAPNANASPGPGHTPQHNEDFDIGSPNWPRPPASPVFNSHGPPATETYRSTKKSDSLAKLYEVDDNPDRRIFLDKLLSYMEDSRKPITACPTISKQPLDLYKLYVYVKERGGFSEVCKVTKSKTWKDIAGLLGIGASSSAAYTLRKHYIKNILPYECQFDRGGIDPLPIIQSIETGAKKKQVKPTSVPSPGSSNSQDSFPTPGSGGGSMDGYAGYPGNYPPTPGQQADYNVSSMPRPASQTNAQSPHTGNPPPSSGDNISVSNPFEDPVGPPRAPYQHQQQGAPYPPVSRPQGTPYQGQEPYNQYMPPNQYGPAGQYPPQQNQYPPNANRGMYPHYGPPETDVNMPPNSGPPATANDPYRYSQQGYPMPPQQAQSQRHPYGQPPMPVTGQPQQPQQPPSTQQQSQNVPSTQPAQAGSPSSQPPTQQPPSSQPGITQPPIPVSTASQNIPSSIVSSGQQAPISQYQPITAQAPSQQSQAPMQPTQAPNQMPGQPQSGPMGPQTAPPYQGQGPPPPTQDFYRQDQPRRHPDFSKDPAAQPYSPYGHQRPQMYGGWPNSVAQYRGQYPPGGPPPPQQWQQGPGQRPPMPGSGMSGGGWDNRYSPNQQSYPQHQPNQQWNSGMPGSPQRPPMGPQRGGKPFAMPPPQASGPPQPGAPMNKMPGQYPGQPVGPQPQQGPHMMQQHPHHPIHPHHSPHMQQSPHSHPGQPQMHHPQQQPPQPGGVLQSKRDVVFPTDSVEAITPLLYRRKRYTKNEIGPVDPWRIFMALRSGLLAESTWALDVLNILLFDDSTITYFGLAHLPGLLNLLLEHFQKSLSDMFDQTKSNNALTSSNSLNGDNNKLSSINSEKSDNSNSCKEIDLGSVTDIPNPDERILVLKSTNNYTMQSRKGIPVKLQDAANDIFITENQKEWDLLSNKNHYIMASLGDDPWTMGQQEPNSCEYIMDCFKAEFTNIPFARYIKSKKRSPTKEEEVMNNNNNNNSSNNNNKNDNNSSNSNNNNKSKKENDIMSVSDQLKIIDNNTNNSNGDNKHRTSNSKIMRLSDDIIVPGVTLNINDKQQQPNRCNNAIKKEPIDSDCRQVDMELEKIPNGPTTNNGENSSDSNLEDNAKVKEEPATTEVPEEEIGFDCKSTVKDPAKVLKRRRMSDYEDECYTRDESSLYLINESEDSLARRCICLSTILRNLTFVPGNELEFARSPVFLAILGKLLLIHHEHPIRTKKQRNYDREEDADFTDSCSSLQGEQEWWWDYITQIRENMLVSLANIAGHLELCNYDEFISRPVLDGLLHWAVCPSAHGQDSFPTISMASSLSPQRLALEALCKLCVTDANVDLVIATPPFSRLEKLCAVLTRQLCKNEDQVLREFSVNLLHYLAAADSTMARTVARQNPCVSYLVAFIEQAEQTALGVANNHGINFLRENPDSMGTSLDMLRRAAGTLLHLSRHPDNRPLFIQQEQRLLGLVMSHILDQQVAMIISKVLFQCSRGPGPLTTTPHEAQNQFATIPGCTSNSNIPNPAQMANKGQPPMPMAMNPMQQPFGPLQPPFMQQPTATMAQPNNPTPNSRPHSIHPVLPQGGPLRLAEEAAKTNNKVNPKPNPVPTLPAAVPTLPAAVPTTIAPTTNQSNPTTTVSPATNIQQTVTASS